MSNEKSALDAMLAQYEKNNAPRYEKTEAKVYDLKNYFNTFLEKGINSGTKQVRILPTKDGSSPFVEMHGHKIQVDGDWKTFPCLKHEKGEACPLCEARDVLLSTGREADKELAKKYNARKMYVVKVIDRADSENTVKFWRFNHDYRKEGIYDKIIGVLNAIKKDVTNVETGRDLLITINRNSNGIPVVSAVASLDPSPLSEDATVRDAILADEKTWESVYAVRNYEYLLIVARGGVPTWDKDEKMFVDLADLTEKKNDVKNGPTNMGVENIKSAMKVADEITTANDVEDEGDDLPF